MAKVLTTDDVKYNYNTTDQTALDNFLLSKNLSAQTNKNKVVATNDYGLVDYSFIKPYTTATTVTDPFPVIVTTKGDNTGKINSNLLDTTSSSAANKIVITDSSGKINYNLLKASTTPTASYIPIADANKHIANGWLDSTVSTKTAAKVVITNSSGNVDNALINSTTGSETQTAAVSTTNKDKIVKTNSSGFINNNLIKTTTTQKQGNTIMANTIVRLDADGKLDKSLVRDGWFIPMEGGEPTGNILIAGPSKLSANNLDSLKAKYPNFYGFGANSYTDGFLIGMNGGSDANQYLVIATHDNGTEPIYVRQYKGTSGYNNMANNIANQITLMDAAGNTTLKGLTVDTNNITVSNGTITANGTGSNALKGSLSVDKDTALKSNVTLGNSSNKNKTDGTQSVITIYGPTVIDRSTGVSGTSDARPALTVGGLNSVQHIEIDNNEIQSKSNATTPAQIWINSLGGNVSIGKDSTITLSKNVSVTNTLGVTGATTLSSTLSVTGNTTIGNSSTASTLTTYGKITGNSGALIKGAVLEAQNGVTTTTLTASSTSTLKGATTIGTTSANANLTVNGNTVITGTSTLTGKITAKGGIDLTGGNITITTNASATTGIGNYIRGQMAANDHWRIAGGAIASNDGYFELATADDSTEPIYIRQYSGDFATLKRTATILNKSGDTSFPGTVTVNGLSTTGAVSVGSLKSTGLVEAGSVKSNGTLVTTGNTSIGGTLGVTGATTLSNTLTVSKATTIGGLLTANGKFIVSQTGDVQLSSNSSAPFILGDPNGAAILMDNCEIMAKSASNASGNLYIQIGDDAATLDNAKTGAGGNTIFGGPVYIGGALTLYSNITASGKTVTAATFKGALDGNAKTATKASSLATESGTSSGARPVWYSYLGDNTKAVYHADKFTYNPGTQTVNAGNFDGKWGGVINQITTHDKAPDLTRWMLTYVDGYIRYITMSEMADKMKSTITSGIDLSSRLPMPSLTTSAIGYIFTGYGRYHTLPSGGTWFWWACCFNANSTSIGPKWGISSGGSEIDLEYDNRRAHFFAMRIKST